MAKQKIDNVTVLTTPKRMMQAIDDNFTELYSLTEVDLDVTRAVDSLIVTNTSGTNAVLPAVSDTLAGVMTATDKVKLDSMVSFEGTDLSFTSNANIVTVSSSTGSSAQIPEATGTVAGIMTAAARIELTKGAASYTEPWK